MSTYTLVRLSDGMPIKQISGQTIAAPSPPGGGDQVWVESKSPGPYYRWNFTASAWDYAGPDLEQLAAAATARRDAALAQSDRTQLPDFPITTEKRAEWVNYRQELRNLPTQEGFPTSITWPVPPAD